MPFVTLKKAVLFDQVPRPDLACSRVGPNRPVAPPVVNVADVKE
jgi:hypothetical protein